MADTNKNLPFDDQLLSAYIDGELTDAERATVEQRLGKDPQARAVVAELRTLSETLQSLPKHALGSDLREAVLQRAADHQATIPLEVRRPRIWIWAVTAAAAALMLMFFQQDARREEQPLAQAQPKEPQNARSDVQLHAIAEGKQEAAQLMSESPLGLVQMNEGVEIGDEADQLAGGAAMAVDGPMKGTLEISAIESPQIEPIGDLPLEDIHVHLTPDDPGVGGAEFDQLLVTYGITLREKTAESSDQRETEKPVTSLQDAELVLVEAPLGQIQQIIAACRARDSRWRSLQLVSQDDARTSSSLFAGREDDAATPAETGVAAALESVLPSKGFTDGDTSESEASVGPPTRRRAVVAQGWAMHLGRGRTTVDQTSTLGLAGSTRGVELEALEKTNQKQHKDFVQAPRDTIRVLFILHPASR